MTKISVVTAITGKKDKLRSQPKYENVSYIAFLDEEKTHSRWKIERACNKFMNPVMNAKIHKILTHLYVDTPYIVWMDGNMTLKQNPDELVTLMGDKDFAFFKHHSRRCLYKEIDACLKVKRGIASELIEQKEAYLKMGIPTKMGMCECPAFVRKNNTKANAAFGRWWEQICRYSSRDQVSFPVAFRGEAWETIPGEVFGENDFFKYASHDGL